MKNLHLSIPLLCCLAIWACNSNSDKEEIRFATLTYGQMWTAVFSQSDGERIEWHGEALDLSAKDQLSLLQTADCGTGACGKLVQLTNNGTQAIEAIVQSTFSIPDFPPYTATKLLIAPSTTATIGCSKLCLDGQEVIFSPKIVGAIYTTE
ncbi:MAG: hypothetical protein KTR30_32175 [Saprospiraceae bacterium]|nr:hypothetical protein [Saprospiraceae bacterium]